MIDLTEILALVERYGLPLVAVFGILLAWSRGWLISGATHTEITALMEEQYSDMEADRNYYRSAWERQAGLTERSTETLREVVRAPARRAPRRSKP